CPEAAAWANASAPPPAVTAAQNFVVLAADADGAVAEPAVSAAPSTATNNPPGSLGLGPPPSPPNPPSPPPSPPARAPQPHAPAPARRTGALGTRGGGAHPAARRVEAGGEEADLGAGHRALAAPAAELQDQLVEQAHGVHASLGQLSARGVHRRAPAGADPLAA